MKDFIYGLYQNDNFTLILVIALVVLIIAFVVVYFFGKKDQKLEETKRLQKIELDAFKQEEKVPEKVEVKEELKKEDEVKETINEDVNVTEFIPDVKEEIEEEVNIPLKKEEEVKPLFKDHEEEEKPISINELSSDLEDEKLENDLSSLESIKNEFNSINIPEVKEEIEKPVFKPSPQIFSSVFVDKKEENIVSNNEEEHVTEIKKEQKPMDAKLFSIIDDEDEEDIELPSLKNEEVTNDLDKINGEVYNLK
ncbi:MAG: hypothetical protein KIC76_02205 [Firmicutes bacterium]|nr:hypothetical protein [Bacillota bacterium]